MAETRARGSGSAGSRPRPRARSRQREAAQISRSASRRLTPFSTTGSRRSTAGQGKPDASSAVSATAAIAGAAATATELRSSLQGPALVQAQEAKINASQPSKLNELHNCQTFIEAGEIARQKTRIRAAALTSHFDTTSDEHTFIFVAPHQRAA